jgi:hypothetical protein
VDGEGCGVVFSGRRLSTPRCQQPSIAFKACRQLAHDKRNSAKGIRKMYCTLLQCSGGNLRLPSLLLLMLVEEGRRNTRQEDIRISIFVGHVICIVILKSTVPVWAKTEERDLSWGECGLDPGCGLETAALREPIERGREKNEEPHIPGSLPPPPFSQEPSTPLSKAPTGPKRWSYFDNYHKLPPSTANSLGVQANCTVQASV